MHYSLLGKIYPCSKVQQLLFTKMQEYSNISILLPQKPVTCGRLIHWSSAILYVHTNSTYRGRHLSNVPVLPVSSTYECRFIKLMPPDGRKPLVSLARSVYKVSSISLQSAGAFLAKHTHRQLENVKDFHQHIQSQCAVVNLTKHKHAISVQFQVSACSQQAHCQAYGYRQKARKYQRYPPK